MEQIDPMPLETLAQVRAERDSLKRKLELQLENVNKLAALCNPGKLIFPIPGGGIAEISLPRELTLDNWIYVLEVLKLAERAFVIRNK